MKIDHEADPATRRRKFNTKEKWRRAALARASMTPDQIAAEESALRAEIEARLVSGDVKRAA